MTSADKTYIKTKKLRGPAFPALLSATIRVAWQRLRQNWLLLGIIWFGLLGLIVLVCVEPLFGDVALSAEVKALARTNSNGASMTAVAISNHLTAAQIDKARTTVNQWAYEELGSLVSASNQEAIITPNVALLNDQKAPNSSGGGANSTSNVLSISGYDSGTIASKVHLISGRLPVTGDQQLEIAVSEKTAHDLKLQPGSQISVRYPAGAGSDIWKLSVVGIISLQPTAGDFWNTQITGAASNANEDSDGVDLGNNTIEYNALASFQAILSAISTITISDPSAGAFYLIWNYHCNIQALDGSQLAPFLKNMDELASRWETQGTVRVSGLAGAWLNPPDIVTQLGNLSGGVKYVQFFAFLLLCLSIGLALLMTGTMAQVLVERQVGVIATMRSRGAPRGQIFWAFALQGIFLLLLAVCIGPIVSAYLVRLLGSTLLARADQPATNPFTGNLLLALAEVRWYVLVVALLALITLLVAIARATQIDILTLRRETARSTRPPFWRRYNLDIIFSVLVCLFYTGYIYSFLSPVANLNMVRLAQEAYSLLAAPLLVIAVTLLFLRILPLFWHLTTRLVARLGSTSALLACAHLERSPQATARFLLLLIVALASSSFFLSLGATQRTWYEDQANFSVGADFQGVIAPGSTDQSLEQLTHHYRGISGVQSASVGYLGEADHQGGLSQIPPVAYQLVDAETYASTALWSTDYSQQSLRSLMQNLKAHRADASVRDVVYVYVDAVMWQQLALTPGVTFVLPVSGAAINSNMHFVALGKITNIPGLPTDVATADQGMSLLADYQSYSTVFVHDNPGQLLVPNIVWLRTASDTASLASVRKAVPGFLDRQALLAAMQSDPIHVNGISIFDTGIATALILAFLGMLIVSGVNIAGRRTNFAALRALGLAPRQIAAILFWEHGLLYLLALAVGCGLSWLISLNVAPVFDLISSTAYNSNNPIGARAVPPIHLSFPSEQAVLLFGGFLLLHLISLLILAYQASRPALSQTLRLNED